MKLGRHIGIEVVCEECGNLFVASQARVKEGLGRFCSLEHWRSWKSKHTYSNKLGKENAKIYLKAEGGYFVQWIQENGKPKNLPWHTWAWEMAHGKVPAGYALEYKDGNKNNITIENLQLRLTRRGKQSLPKERKVLSAEHKNKISQRLVENWKNGVFDIHRGANNKNWKPNPSRHPKEFSKELKDFIRERDAHTCQICGEDLVSKQQPVHHIDGIKFHNNSDNLILLCKSCHCKIHLTSGKTSPVIMAFRSKLLE